MTHLLWELMKLNDLDRSSEEKKKKRRILKCPHACFKDYFKWSK